MTITKRVPVKGLFFILFFLSFNSKANISSSHETWRNLLYIERETKFIEDPSFYLAGKLNSAENEYKLASNILSEKPKSKKICQFPARFFWLKNALGRNEPLNFSHCPKLLEFLKRAPAKRISLVFASENISIPSSMMGHIYLKLDGINNENQEVSHAISYFTDVAGGNFPKLIWETVFIGKKGYYALSPNEQLRINYLKNEERNLWEYELDLDDFERKLLHLHLFELRNIKLKYFFHRFNCATLMLRLIKVPKPQIPSFKRPWVTPLDVVRRVYKGNIIKQQYVELSKRWKLKAIVSDNMLEEEDIFAIGKLNYKGSNFVANETYQTFLDYKLEKKDLSFSQYNKISKKILLSQNQKLDFSDYKNPAKTKLTSQFAIEAVNYKGESYKGFSLLPASHLIEDDSSEYLNDSELEIGHLKLAWNEIRRKLIIDEYVLYSSLMLMPYDSLTGGLSTRFALGYLSFFDHELDQRRSTVGTAMAGQTFRLHHDLDFYWLAGSSIVGNFELVPSLETGIIIREVHDMKTFFNITSEYFSKHEYRQVLSTRAKQILDFGMSALVLDYAKFFNSEHEYSEFGVRYKWYF